MKLKTKRTSKGHYAAIIDDCLPIRVLKFNKNNFYQFARLEGQEAVDYWQQLTTSIKEIEVPDDALLNKAERLAEKKVAEKQRVSLMTNKLTGFTSSYDLAKFCESEFKMSLTETAGHWSDRYNHLNDVGLIIDSAEDYEVTQLIRKIYPDGLFEYNLCKFKNGQDYGEYVHGLNNDDSFDGLAKEVREHYDHYVRERLSLSYKSKETEEEEYLENIQYADNMTKVEKLVTEWKTFEAGYYDTSGNLEISEKEYNDMATGYQYDNYGVAVCFIIPQDGLIALEEEDITDYQSELNSGNDLVTN